MSTKSSATAEPGWQELPQHLWQSIVDAARPWLSETGSADAAIQRLLAMLGSQNDDFSSRASAQLLAGSEHFVQWANQLVRGLAETGGALGSAGSSERWAELLKQSLAAGSDSANPLGKLMQQGIELMARPLDAGFANGNTGSHWRSAVDALLRLPNFGFAREHQERRQKLLRAALAFQDALGQYQELLGKAGRRGLDRLRDKLAEREQPGRQIDSLRGLYDLWIDAAEEAYAEIALSSEFRQVYGAMVNRQVALRQAMQIEVEHCCTEFGLPTRTELNAVHKRLHGMRRQLRALEEELASQRDAKVLASAARPSQGRAPKAATRKLGKTPPKVLASQEKKPSTKKSTPARAISASPTGAKRAATAAPKSRKSAHPVSTRRRLDRFA